MKAGKKLKSQDSVLWLEEIQCFHTDNPAENMLKIQERELQEHDFE